MSNGNQICYTRLQGPTPLTNILFLSYLIVFRFWFFLEEFFVTARARAWARAIATWLEHWHPPCVVAAYHVHLLWRTIASSCPFELALFYARSYHSFTTTLTLLYKCCKKYFLATYVLEVQIKKYFKGQLCMPLPYTPSGTSSFLLIILQHTAITLWIHDVAGCVS